MAAAGAILWTVVVIALQATPPPGQAVVVSGRVVDAISGRPIAGVIVTPAGSAVVIAAAAPLAARALTNGAGEFVLRDLRKGALALTAAKNGYADATYNQRRPNGSGQTIPLEDGQRLAGVEMRMSTGQVRSHPAQ